jgi:hypothetical protein
MNTPSRERLRMGDQTERMTGVAEAAYNRTPGRCPEEPADGAARKPLLVYVSRGPRET